MSITFDPKGIWRNRKLRLLQLVHDLKSMFSKSQLNSCITIFELNKHNMPWLIKCFMLFCRYLFSSLSCLRDLDMMTMFLGEFDTFNTLTMSGTKLPGEFDTFTMSATKVRLQCERSMVGDAHRGIRDRPPALPSLGAPHRGQCVLENSGLTIFWRQNDSDSSLILKRFVIVSSWPGHPLQSSLGKSLHRSRSSVDWYLQCTCGTNTRPDDQYDGHEDYDDDNNNNDDDDDDNNNNDDNNDDHDDQGPWRCTTTSTDTGPARRLLPCAFSPVWKWSSPSELFLNHHRPFTLATQS